MKRSKILGNKSQSEHEDLNYQPIHRQEVNKEEEKEYDEKTKNQYMYGTANHNMDVHFSPIIPKNSQVKDNTDANQLAEKSAVPAGKLLQEKYMNHNFGSFSSMRENRIKKVYNTLKGMI